jgi:hypothetical protein
VDMAFDPLACVSAYSRRPALLLHVSQILDRIQTHFGVAVDCESLVSSLTKKVARGECSGAGSGDFPPRRSDTAVRVTRSARFPNHRSGLGPGCCRLRNLETPAAGWKLALRSRTSIQAPPCTTLGRGGACFSRAVGRRLRARARWQAKACPTYSARCDVRHFGRRARLSSSFAARSAMRTASGSLLRTPA